MAFGRFQTIPPTDGTKSGPKPLMLVIDDDITVRQTLEFMFTQRGYRVILCEDGKNGLKQVHNDVTTVILDIKMPGMNGFEVYEQIRIKFPEVPVIFYSAYQDVMEGIEMRRKYQAYSYVDKNGDVEKLFSVIERVVQHRRIQKNLEMSKNYMRQMKESASTA